MQLLLLRYADSVLIHRKALTASCRRCTTRTTMRNMSFCCCSRLCRWWTMRTTIRDMSCCCYCRLWSRWTVRTMMRDLSFCCRLCRRRTMRDMSRCCSRLWGRCTMRNTMRDMSCCCCCRLFRCAAASFVVKYICNLAKDESLCPISLLTCSGLY